MQLSIASLNTWGGGVILNHTYGITDTRTKHYTKPVREADFVVVSRSLRPYVADLSVDLSAPSDHGTLMLRLNL
jgi:hypothetical protein